MYIIAGLGNPGNNYKWTRHNVGFEVISKLAYDNNIDMKREKFKAVIGEGRIGNEKVMLIKPLTYMNLSGESVIEAVNFYKTDIKNIIVSCDDINLPLGSIRVRKSGSSGGQKGLDSIIYHLERQDFPRVRVGVGFKPQMYDMRDFVLSKFTDEETEDIISAITDASNAIEMIIKNPSDGVSRAMNLYNKKVRVNRE